MRANGENDLMMFDGDDGTQIAFGAEDIWWRSQSLEGDGNPPCLRTPQEKVDVELGLMDISRPGGGSFRKAVWVKCP